MADDVFYMKQALQEAVRASERGEVPVGAVVVCRDRIIARSHNLTETLNDVTAHAEMQAITAAANALGGKYLTDCTLYVTVEPCVMCAGLIAHARLSRVVYAARDEKTGAYGGAIDLQSAAKFTHKVQVDGGIMAKEASLLLTKFFGEKRHA